MFRCDFEKLLNKVNVPQSVRDMMSEEDIEKMLTYSEEELISILELAAELGHALDFAEATVVKTKNAIEAMRASGDKND